ncbi:MULTISPECIES: hypothetical protein [unclassified Inquilinus]|uniref:hypothetical protein n=1 Tax=unclassified Inquilinus TaxID=2645927 RepID=UPI003F90E764
MAKRSTIQNDPLGKLGQPTGEAVKPDQPTDEAVEAAVGAPADAPGPARRVADRGRAAVSTLTDVARKTLGGRPRGALAERMKLVAGGRLELLGGDFGVGLVRIRRLGPDGRFGFVAPGGEQVILDAEVAAMRAWPDRQEQRLLSATGWAWTVGSVIGPVGVALGAGIRLLHPGQRMLNLRLRDGRTLVARTDSVTVAGLDALALMAGADAASQPS